MMDFYDYSWKDFLDTFISTVEYIIFYQGGTIDYGTNFPGTFSQSRAESEYKSE